MLPNLLGLTVFALAAWVREDALLLLAARVMLVINIGLTVWHSRREHLRLPQVLIWASVYAFLTGIPLTWGQVWFHGFNRQHAALAAVVFLLLAASVIWRHPAVGVVGGMSLLAILQLLLRRIDYGFDIAWQVSYWYLLLHSCRWGKRPHWGAVLLRRLTALILLVHAWVWVFDRADRGAQVTMALAFAVLVAWLIAWRVCRRDWPRLIPVTAGAALVIVPIHQLCRFAEEGLGGFVIIFVALLFFGAGTLLALNRTESSSPIPATGPQP